MTAAPWRIRPAGPDDADTLALVGAATFLESFAGLVDGAGIALHCARQHSAEAYRAYFAKGAKAWIAEIEPGGAPIGYALLARPELAQAEDGDIELKRIYLLEEAQGAGLGKALLEAVLEWLETRFDHVYLGVYFENFRAQEIYRRYGFEKVGEYHFMVGNHADPEWIMKKAAPRA